MIKKLTNKLKNKRVVIAIIILIFITLSFYWYEVRPSNIKKDCSQLAIIESKRGGRYYVDETKYKAEYQRCLQQRGL